MYRKQFSCKCYFYDFILKHVSRSIIKKNNEYCGSIEPTFLLIIINTIMI